MYEDPYKRRQRLGLDPISRYKRKVKRNPLPALTIVLALLAGLAIGSIPTKVSYERGQTLPDPCELDVVTCDGEEQAYVTGYNTVPEQTDSTPCIAASGANICGREDAVACPRHVALGTIVEIDGKQYICEDRTHPKYDGRYDISCDKDRTCPRRVTGYKTILVINE